jgi:hypothetical protein
VLRTESQVRESKPQLGIYFERGTAPAFQRMGYATEILPYDRLGSNSAKPVNSRCVGFASDSGHVSRP